MEFNATFIVAFVSFIVFAFIMNAILYKPVCAIVEKRKKLVDFNYEEANSNIGKKDSLLHEREEKLEKAMLDAKELVAQRTNEITQQKNSITQKATDEAKKNIEAYNVYYDNATAQAKEYLQNETVGLAQLISDKLLGVHETIDDNEFNDLIKG